MQLVALAAVLASTSGTLADDWQQDEVFAGPASRSQRSEWLAYIKLNRSRTLVGIGWDGYGVYNVSGLEWTQSNFVQPYMHPFDRKFYNYSTAQYTPELYVDYLKEQYGGVDSVLLWPTYPMTGVDDRNQFDLWRAAPSGGIQALATAIQALKAQGVRVLMPYNPWDQGTRYEGRSDPVAMADLLEQLDADGFNGDTMSFVNQTFYTAATKYGKHISIEPELGGNHSTMKWSTQGWGYWPFQLGRGPPVDGYKWLDGRRVTGICNRWAQNHTADLMHAWFNGIAFVSWQNVWTVYNRMTARDSEATRRFATMARYLGRKAPSSGPAIPPLLRSRSWEPYVVLAQEADEAGVFGSVFPAEDGSATAYTLVSWDGRNYSGPVLQLDPSGHPQGTIAYDCYHGQSLGPISSGAAISLDVEAGAFGCVLLTTLTEASSPSLAGFLRTMSSMSKRALASYDATWRYTLQEMVSYTGLTTARAQPRPGTTRLPAGLYHFETQGMEIEGNDDRGVDVQFPWESHPQREHQASMTMPAFDVQVAPTTCSQYAEFLSESSYKPADSSSFLKNWDWNSGQPVLPAELKNKPVTYVSLRDAERYCEWSGMRLPLTYEWQWAAQVDMGRPNNTDLNPYPWGPHNNASCLPQVGRGRTLPGPSDVDAMPGYCNSSSGLVSLVGNVWQYTSEFQDEHSRGVVLKGGSNYQPQGSKWYFPQPKDMRLDYHNKLILWDDSYERAGTVGFRCVGGVPKSVTREALCRATPAGKSCSFLLPVHAKLDFARAVAGFAPIGAGYESLALSIDEREERRALVLNASSAGEALIPSAAVAATGYTLRVLALVDTTCAPSSARVADIGGGGKTDELILAANGFGLLRAGHLAGVSGRHVVAFEVEQPQARPGGSVPLAGRGLSLRVRASDGSGSGSGPRGECRHTLVQVGVQQFVAYDED